MEASTNSNQSDAKKASIHSDALVNPKQTPTESSQLDLYPENSDSSRLNSEDFERKIRKLIQQYAPSGRPSGTLSWLAHYFRSKGMLADRLSSEDFERNVRRLIEQRAPFCALSNVWLFNAEQALLSIGADDESEHTIFACEIDHLIHQRLNDTDVVIIVECKNQSVIVKDEENWLVHYFSLQRNVQYQLQRQAKALLAILNPLGGGRNLRVEAYVVSCDPMTERRTRRVDDWLTLHLLSEESFGDVLKNLSSQLLPVVQSGVLELLRLAIPVRELGHPEMPNAIAYIECCRHALDADFFDRFNRPRNGKSADLVADRLRLNYRSPFAIYAASLGLLFRWFADSGPKVIPSCDELENVFGFSVGNVSENPALTLSICGHLHPANSWSNCIRTFPNCAAALAMLQRWRFRPEEVLWIRFAIEDGTFDYKQLNRFTYRHTNFLECATKADKDVRCQDFPIVVIEGLSEDVDFWTLPESEQKMWKKRKELYLYASRATAFLFIIPRVGLSQENQLQDEVAEMVRQLSSPTKENDGFDWTWRFAINPTEKIRSMEVFTDEI